MAQTDLPTVRIKICGITRREDARIAIEAGADAIGLVFHDRSPRAVTVSRARELVAGLPPFVTVTGLFVNAALHEIESIAAQVGLNAWQLHGDEPPGFCNALSGRIIKALRVAEASDLRAAAAYQVAAILYDAKVSGVPGGTGRTFDWSLLRHHPGHRPMILAGGLHPGNVAEAISQVRPYAVDVSSGVESSPGIKDPALIRRFIQEVHRTCRGF
ncbi:MAG: phosphoribosylanthranilate isomerase [Magnetococcales bacterium]|nr:phosphoribosylanthranilate isomerase [Magnetococcales bacterium]MBF0150696.1 phosphoribosylanthranilate isomerase [Magnetococcales bacterium]MBF0175016.1 phosphoribosylanthranilate isomerase [Magnetococcales bacterium]MBF0348245.1 phosphoribosylanthranilate isomerase [Magnetococcales bacterium]MBF0631682.1 phosphoribosylanthranilate isomerase [Magnetococcales bacterium]